MLWVLWLLFPIIAGVAAERKGRSGGGWFLLGLLIGPFSLVVLALPSIEEKRRDAARHGEINEFRKCPACAEIVRAEAKVCRFCQRELPPMAPAKRHLSDTPETQARDRTIFLIIVVIIALAWLAAALF